MPIFSQILTSRHRLVPCGWLIENLEVRRCKYYYRPPTKLWKGKGNVFSRVCLLVILSSGCPMWPLPMTQWTSPSRELSAQGPALALAPTVQEPPLVLTLGSYCNMYSGQALVCIILKRFLAAGSFWVCLVIEWEGEEDLVKRYDCLMLITWLINNFIYQ